VPQPAIFPKGPRIFEDVQKPPLSTKSPNLPALLSTLHNHLVCSEISGNPVSKQDPQMMTAWQKKAPIVQLATLQSLVRNGSIGIWGKAWQPLRKRPLDFPIFPLPFLGAD